MPNHAASDHYATVVLGPVGGVPVLVPAFGEEAVAIAYDRTVTSTGSLKWPYMNTILKNWHEKGLHSAQEIEEKDTRRPRAASAKSGGGKPIKIDELRDIINKI